MDITRGCGCLVRHTRPISIGIHMIQLLKVDHSLRILLHIVCHLQGGTQSTYSCELFFLAELCFFFSRNIIYSCRMFVVLVYEGRNLFNI